jgi:predicted nucleic acid-binding Zn ribbon protein
MGMEGHPCEVCGVKVYGPVGRKGKVTCSDACRSKLYRDRKWAGGQES